MRHIGSLEAESEAHSLRSYLMTQKIRCMVEEEAGQWAVWIFEEDQVERGREELAAFRNTPEDPKYAAAVLQANRLEREARKLKELKDRHVDARQQWQKPMMQRAPVTFALILITALVCIVTTSLEGRSGMMGPQLCNKPSASYLMISNYPGRSLPEVASGQFWRLVTPIFLHGSLMHILFNMLWTRDLGAAIEFRRGSWRYLGLVLFCAIVSNFAQYYIEGPAFGGMSGVGFGFFGYVYIKSRFEPTSGLFMSQNLMFMGVAWLLLGFTNIMPIANWAHLFGMLSGGVVAYAPIALRGMKTE